MKKRGYWIIMLTSNLTNTSLPCFYSFIWTIFLVMSCPLTKWVGLVWSFLQITRSDDCRSPFLRRYDTTDTYNETAKPCLRVECGWMIDCLDNGALQISRQIYRLKLKSHVCWIIIQDLVIFSWFLQTLSYFSLD